LRASPVKLPDVDADPFMRDIWAQALLRRP